MFFLSLSKIKLKEKETNKAKANKSVHLIYKNYLKTSQGDGLERKKIFKKIITSSVSK